MAKGNREFPSLGGSFTPKPIESCPGGTLRICGDWGSPYTQKMIAVCRYRRIPYRFVTSPFRDQLLASLPRPPVALAPTFYFGDEPMVDSTPIIQHLEQLYGGRSLVHPNPGMAMLAAMIEDFGDELITKCMYHYRWDGNDDATKASFFLPLTANPAMPQEQLEQISSFIRKRQVSRLDFVGSNSVTKPAIEGTFVRVVQLLDAHLAAGYTFLFGQRPSTADFSLFGQLSQLHRVENTSRLLLEKHSYRVASWISIMTDLSGRPVADEDWISTEAPLPSTLKAIIAEMGILYAPFMVANAAAVESNKERLTCELGKEKIQWDQPPFSYQAKCLAWLNKEYWALSPPDKMIVDAALVGTGCEVLFAKSRL